MTYLPTWDYASHEKVDALLPENQLEVLSSVLTAPALQRLLNKYHIHSA